MRSVIHAYQEVLLSHEFPNSGLSFPEEFAIRRFRKKLEKPDPSRLNERRLACQEEFFNFDRSLSLSFPLRGKWYRARQLIHTVMDKYRSTELQFTNGSESHPTGGRGSIESKLSRSRWECTPNCFDDFAEKAYDHLAIKRAAKQRLRAMCRVGGLDYRSLTRNLWHRSHDPKACFREMLSYVTYVREASRFGTVRKNNLKDRPIDVQPLCNMLVQRSIGVSLRNLLRDSLGRDLLTLADRHREMIKDRRFATIDLSNASDGIQLELVRFLFPSWFMKKIENARPEFVEDLDGNFHLLKKVSSMGNGFTFELMTLIFTAISLQYSEESSVFGDDIIIPKEHADSLIEDLESVGLVVNREKTFTSGPFRESCGANYHDDFGYLESYDFWWPESIHDCCVIFNKVKRLAKTMPAFRPLVKKLLRPLPQTLRGPVALTASGAQGRDDDHIPSFFGVGTTKGEAVDDHIASRLRLLDLNPENFYKFYGFVFKPTEVSRMIESLKPSKHYGKYAMYLHGARKVRDTLTHHGSWVTVALISDGIRTFRARDLR